MNLELFSFETCYLAVVRTGNWSLETDRDMYRCDNVTQAIIRTILAACLSLETSALVFFHGTTLYSFTTAKGARQENVVASPLDRIKMALEVPHLSCPLTTFFMMLAVYLEIIDLTLEELVEAGIRENIHFTTLWAILFASLEKM